LLNVEWTEDALEDLDKLDKAIANRILNKITWFALLRVQVCNLNLNILHLIRPLIQ